MMKLNNKGEEEILDRIFFKCIRTFFFAFVDFQIQNVESKKYFFILIV